MLDGNFPLGCGPGTDYPLIHTFQCTLERTDAITNEVLEPITFVLAYPTIFRTFKWHAYSTLQHVQLYYEVKAVSVNMARRVLRLPTVETPPDTHSSGYCSVEAVAKAGDTPSSRHVSSCDVTRAVGM